MAGRPRRATREAGRSSRAASSPAKVAAASGVGSGSRTARSTPVPSPSTVQTRSTYRGLLLRGLAPGEAANLTAFLSGLHVGEQRWNLSEINQLLFLRELNRSGRFTETIQGSTPAA